MVAQEDHGRPDVDRPSKANASAVEDVVWMVYKVGLMSSRCQGCLGMAGRATTEWFLVLLPSIPVHSIHRSKDVKWIKMDSLFWAIKAEHVILEFRMVPTLQPLGFGSAKGCQKLFSKWKSRCFKQI